MTTLRGHDDRPGRGGPRRRPLDHRPRRPVDRRPGPVRPAGHGERRATATSTSRCRSTTAARSGCSRPASTEMVGGPARAGALRDLFGRHVGADVARAALDDGPASAARCATVAVLFVDIIGSTAWPPTGRRPEVVDAAQPLLRRGRRRRRAHGGWINKFEGDAALASSARPLPLDDPAGARARRGPRAGERLPAEVPDLAAGDRRVRRAGGGRQHRRRAPLRVHRDRRPGERGRPPHRAGQGRAR